MTDPTLWAIAAGSSILSLVGLYIGWRGYRVFLLRLRLLQIRNRLWDDVYAIGQLDNDTYRRVRSQLNQLIRHAHRIDLISLALTAERTNGMKGTRAKNCLFREIESLPPDLREPIDKAMSRVGRLMGRYVLLYRPFTGIVLCWGLVGLFRTCKVIRLLTHSPSQRVNWTVDKVRQFATHPSKSSRQWFEHDGPSRISGHCAA